ncbi:amino acid adenylation domain-containing protein [Streptomyces sp. P9(2023)]|uniref:non-ribosomal peptide synthetase n=1 Tax=Streptomyces sp. P9(2023) TaxID=3064394 RepID=UPI0028F3FF3A|nr:amino acid adenylation domain-containing protein [Streptomyces sp. P9(2023)]MDT9687536.1 amino acid adenylation domain-containing protein [Streptomyces sp. P9(2023)]
MSANSDPVPTPPLSPGAAPPALLPADRPRMPGATPDRTASARVRLGPSARTAPEDVLLAGFTALVHRWSGQSEFGFVARTPRAGTPFGGTAFRMSRTVSGTETLTALAAGEPDDRREPLGPSARQDEFELLLHPPGAADDGPPGVELRYAPELFDHDTVGRILASYVTLLEDGLAHPDRPVSRLRLLPDDALRRMLVEWNDTATDLPYETCLHTAFEDRATASPGAYALVGADRTWTYREVNEAANRLAHRLRELGVGPDRRVGICLERSAELLITVLGVLKAGGAYVPLDPDYPRQRLATMVAGTACTVVVSRSGPADSLPPADDGDGPGTPALLLDRDAALLAGYGTDNPEGGATPDDLAYIIHTSGSTGAPKPIALRHRGVMNNIADLNSRFGVGPGDRVLALSSPSFDMSVYEFLGLTTAGGTVILTEPERAKDPEHWADLLATHRVTVWNSAPALLDMVVDHLEVTGAEPLGDLRLALLGGDWIPVSLPDRARAVAPALRFVALGGATESSIHSTIHEVTKTDPRWTSIPYGRPMANQRTYILDEALQPVPPGVPGELHLAGTGLAREYLGRPEQTAERFFTWSCGEVSDERLYRTGDVARYGPDGLIELLGRADFQVKLHGLRIELGEIEAVLRAHDTVREAVVAAHPDGAGDRRLVAYLVPEAGRTVEPAAVGEHAARSLPGFMVPGTVLVLDDLPLTPNGKVDRKALPAPPESLGEPDAAWTAPATETERTVAGVFTAVLGTTMIGTDSGFFAVGGNSLQAMRAVTRLNKHFGIRVNVRLLYGGSTVSGIAAAIDERLARTSKGTSAP